MCETLTVDDARSLLGGPATAGAVRLAPVLASSAQAAEQLEGDLAVAYRIGSVLHLPPSARSCGRYGGEEAVGALRPDDALCLLCARRGQLGDMLWGRVHAAVRTAARQRLEAAVFAEPLSADAVAARAGLDELRRRGDSDAGEIDVTVLDRQAREAARRPAAAASAVARAAAVGGGGVWQAAAVAPVFPAGEPPLVPWSTTTALLPCLPTRSDGGWLLQGPAELLDGLLADTHGVEERRRVPAATPGQWSTHDRLFAEVWRPGVDYLGDVTVADQLATLTARQMHA